MPHTSQNHAALLCTQANFSLERRTNKPVICNK